MATNKQRVLTLNLKSKWWHQIHNGEKNVELRRATEYWRKRLVGRTYDEIHLLLGYPQKGDESKLLRRKYTHWTFASVLHEEFGPKLVDVFVIDVSHPIERGIHENCAGSS